MDKKTKKQIKSDFLIDRRIELLKNRGFQFDKATKVWFIGDQFIKDSVVKDLKITFFYFGIMVSRIKQLQNYPAPYDWPTYRSLKNSREEYLDALDFRLPGSYGTGKRR